MRRDGLDDILRIAAASADQGIEPALLRRIERKHRSVSTGVNVALFPHRRSAFARRSTDGPTFLHAALAGLCALLAAYAFSLSPRYLGMWDVLLVATSHSVAGLFFFRTMPLPALAMLAVAAGYASSVLRLEGVPLPNELFGGIAAAMLWAVVIRHGHVAKAGRVIASACAVASVGLGPLAVLSGSSYSTAVAWVASLCLASVAVTHRCFALDLFRDGRILFSALSFMPICANLALSFVVPMSYGQTWPTAANLIASLAPLGCVAHAVWLAKRTDREDTAHGEHHEQLNHATAGSRAGIRLG